MKSKLPVQWCSLPVAAEVLGMTPGALRKIVERNARPGQDGVEAELNGVRARKLGRLWRVSLSSAWSETIPSTPKSGHERSIPIAPQLLELLRKAGSKAKHELVAKNSDGEPWGEFGLLLAFQRAQKKAGFSGWRFHDLRHAFVTALFRGGAPAPAVQALAGHADITTTSRYAHLVQADLREAVARLA
jgi:integrase